MCAGALRCMLDAISEIAVPVGAASGHEGERAAFAKPGETQEGALCVVDRSRSRWLPSC
jgi:hypothetical protein